MNKVRTVCKLEEDRGAGSYKINADNELSLTTATSIHFGWTRGSILICHVLLHTRLRRLNLLTIGTGITGGLQLRSTTSITSGGVYGSWMVCHLVLTWWGHRTLGTAGSGVVLIAGRTARSAWLIHGRQAGLRGVGRGRSTGGGGDGTVW